MNNLLISGSFSFHELTSCDSSPVMFASFWDYMTVKRTCFQCRYKCLILKKTYIKENVLLLLHCNSFRPQQQKNIFFIERREYFPVDQHAGGRAAARMKSSPHKRMDGGPAVLRTLHPLISSTLTQACAATR